MKQKVAGQFAEVLTEFRPDPNSTQPPAVEKALFLARALQERALNVQTPQERRQQAELDRMLQNPTDKATLVQMTDQSFRARSADRVADQFTHILDVQGVPRFFSPLERTLLKGFQSFGNYLPDVAVPLVKGRMQQETANVILPAETDLLTEHLRKRREQGVRMNVNFLGEAILSEAEAQRRLEQYLEILSLPEVEVVSVKISTLYSQISTLAREHTVLLICDRLELFYRAAARAQFQRSNGARGSKFVYLDMEEYRDMNLTAEVFMRTLDRPGLEHVEAGIALQAYLPDSVDVQRRINHWASARVDRGGAPVTLRLVKGANLEMERVEAALHNWPQAPFVTKVDTDANYKRMLHEAIEHLPAVKLGVASHNLFDVAYAFVLAHEAGALDRVQFEMLEGMANHQRRALHELNTDLLLYAPICHRTQFIHAIGYLIRRLDENTGPENFLRHAFRLQVDSQDWRELEAAFLDSFERLPRLPDGPRRTQNRAEPPARPPDRPWTSFANEPDTDWALPHHAVWAADIIERWQPRHGPRAVQVPLVVWGQDILNDTQMRDNLDPSRPGVVVARYCQASATEVDQAIQCAEADEDHWRTLPAVERQEVLRRVAQELRGSRADLLGAALAVGGKLLTESDPEVSEAVDFVEFYADTARDFSQLESMESSGIGVVVVVSPWNFPIAIPCGGVAAALAAGNTVILKPASDAVLIAHELCQCFWRAGISKKTLQLVPCRGAREGQQLVQHPTVGAVILTGGTSTAMQMLEAKPDLPLTAETGGKNGTIVTALSDRDLAIKNVLHSAFSHSGQKCSATSLLLLEAEVYEDPLFKRALVEAAESITVGSAWDVASRLGPLIRPPSGDLENALKTLEVGETWALMPRHVGNNPNLWSPGIKWGVQPGSYTHLTEFFGPVLGVMRFEKLHEAIALVNQTGYGLTSGLESLDDREHELWKANIRAGNLYLNRSTVGAIVLRQPFGGMGKSAFGPGIKAGGPNYVAQFMQFRELTDPPGSAALHDELLSGLADHLKRQVRLATPESQPAVLEPHRVLAAFASYDQVWHKEFGVQHDHFQLLGQDNIRRYLPVRDLRIRVHRQDSFFDVFARVGAARTAGCHITISLPAGLELPMIDWLAQWTESWAGAIEFVEETDEQLAQSLIDQQTDRVRFAHPSRVPLVVRKASAESGIYLADRPVLQNGRFELLWYVTEQSLSIDYHRYGNLGTRSHRPGTS